LLRLAMTGSTVPLPDLTPILPYLGLYTIVVLIPDKVHRHCIPTMHLPTLTIIRNRLFVPAPRRTSATKPDVARIFDVLALVGTDPPISMSFVPLSPQHIEFNQQRYWRLPAYPEAIFVALNDRVGRRSFDAVEIGLTQRITSEIIHVGGRIGQKWQIRWQ
jgi:hypothetical protein